MSSPRPGAPPIAPRAQTKMTGGRAGDLSRGRPRSRRHPSVATGAFVPTRNGIVRRMTPQSFGRAKITIERRGETRSLFTARALQDDEGSLSSYQAVLVSWLTEAISPMALVESVISA